MLTSTKRSTAIELIVSRSRSLTERLTLDTDPQITNKNQAQIESRRSQWCQVVAQGDETKFKRRLAWGRLDANKIRPLLLDDDRVCGLTLPQWADILERIIEKAKTLSSQEIFASPAYSDRTSPIPFEHLYLPLVLVARDVLGSKIINSLDTLSKSSQVQLEKQLVSQLAEICTTTLMAEFADFRSSGNQVQEFLLSKITKCDRDDKYREFIHNLLTDGLVSFWEKYSVLGKLVAITIELWSNATAEFIFRLSQDWREIERRFLAGKTLKQVIDLQTGLSDPHNGKKTVIILTFDTGLKLVYKPKNLAIEIAYFQFLDWCNKEQTLLHFQLLQVYNRGDYGWVEFIESLPCQDIAEARRYYQRTGMLLCLISLLSGIDCHIENVINCGEQPILIDAETLLHHNYRVSSLEVTDAVVSAKTKLNQSPLTTFILPQWGVSSEDNLNLDASLLGKQANEVISIPQWKNINTNGMSIDYEVKTINSSNVPCLGDTPLNVQNYLAQLVAGFEEMYRFLLARQDILLATDSPLEVFARLKVRYVFRPTNIYNSILKNSLTPNLLQSGIDRSISLDVLSRAFIQSESKPEFWQILETELQAMEQLDIPFLNANTSDISLGSSTEIIVPKLFEKSSLEQVLFQFKLLSEADLKEQLAIVNGAFRARFMEEPLAIVDHNTNLDIERNHIPLKRSHLVQESIALAENLQQQAIYGRDNSVTWIGIALRSSYPYFQLQDLSLNLYDGCSGVALFLAALAKVTHDSNWHNLALQTLSPLENILNNSDSSTVKKLSRLGIGGATGLGSVVYALIQASHFLEDSELLENARQVANLITPELVAADRHFNLMQGAAGAILSCLKLYRVTGEGLQQAIACGKHLLQHQSEIGNQLKIGFARGAGGIAYALLQLFAITNNEQFLEAAEKAIAYEQKQGYLVNSFNNWTHGAAGIGLGRLAGLSVLDNTKIRQDISVALAQTESFCLTDIDNLGWGNLGRIETLLVASEKLNRPDLLDFVLSLTTQIIQKAQINNKYNLFSPPLPFYQNPGFYQGITGIGYQILRIAYPNLLPSILLWD